MKGGYRPGSGRPPGSKTARLPAPPTAESGAMNPLAYLLAVMNNAAEPTEVRMRAAGMALPFVHPKPAPPTAKDRRQAMAETAEAGTDWESLLNPNLPDLYRPRRVKPYGSG